MTSSIYFYAVLLGAAALSSSATAAMDHSENTNGNSNNNNGGGGGTMLRSLQGGGQQGQQQQPSFDFFDPDEDLCDNGDDPANDRPVLGQCDFGRFPTCADNEDICYNRKPSRDHFHPDNHQHRYYIQYDRVFCYPLEWGGCSSCTPGRYCASEKRCILEEEGYPCTQWF